MMSPDRWSEVEDLYHAVVERSPAERAALLSQCPDEEVRREVQSLLDHEQEGEDLLEHPGWKPTLSQAIADQSRPSLAAGTKLGPYEILGCIGAGGMGEVYRARDTKLGRNVAFKVLPEEFDHEADRMARFRREARVLASLNHPNIAAIYGLEESHGVCALVMELVEGPTLAGRIGKRALAREEVLRIAGQMAAALEYAHEKGIIHRDLKPANVKLTSEGSVKLVDFGLAKAFEEPGQSGGPAATAAEGTCSGVILGTPAYMAPEQAEAKPVDRRADVWAFGVVLYEMLTGKALYEGESSAEILASVIRDAPNLDALPSNFRYLVGRCVCKDPHERWQSIGDVRIAIQEAAEALAAEAQPAGTRRRLLRNRLFAVGTALVLLAGLSAIGFRVWRYPSPSRPPVAVPITSGIGWALYPSWSPDGAHIAYSWKSLEDPAFGIYVKQIGTGTELRVTSGSAWDTNPAWSPDGRWIAFYRGRSKHSGYYLVSPLGGPVRQLLPINADTLVDTNLLVPSMAWFPDGRHIAATLPSGLVSVDIETGEQKQLTAMQGIGDVRPAVSPDGKTVAFIRCFANASADIYLADSAGNPAQRLTHYETFFVGLDWTPDGRELVFAMEQNGISGLWRIAVKGGAAHLITSTQDELCCPSIARQGDQLAYVEFTSRWSLWRCDILVSDRSRASAPVRLISSVRADTAPTYSRDGQKVAFASNRTGPFEIWEAAADGSEAVQLTHAGGSTSGPYNGSPRWSPDGFGVAFDSNLEGHPQIMVVTEAGRKARRITKNLSEDVVPTWSGDGRWIYFASSRRGDFQIYKIRSDQIESTSNSPVQVTTRGGFNAVESPDAEYLYYAKGRGQAGGLWRRRLNGPPGDSEELVLGSLQYWGWWAFGPNGIFFLEQESAYPWKVHLKFLNLRSKQITNLRTLEYPVDETVASLTVSPDGRHVVFEQVENRGSKIVMIENFR